MSLMHYFTPAWRDGELTDDDFENACVAYDQHLRDIRGALPARLRRLVETVSLHDAEVRKAMAQRERRFHLALRAGDQQRGYVDLDLYYEDVEVLEGVPSVAEVLNRSDAELLRDEVDVIPSTNTYEHRFLFAPEGEVLVRFGRFTFGVRPVAHREFTRADPVFVESNLGDDDDEPHVSNGVGG